MMVLPLLSSCAVQIQNERFYVDEGSLGAVWFETLTNSTGNVSKANWDSMRVGMGCATADTLAEIKREIEQLCSMSAKCNYSTVKDVLAKFQSHIVGFE